MSAQEADFFSHYLSYTSNTETPAIFNRWSLIAGIGAFLGRQYYFEHGHFAIYPNMYTMLVGSAGTRKSTAIKTMKKLLIQAGYTTIAADRSTKEKFLLDLAGEDLDTPINGANGHDILEQNLFGTGNSDDKEMFIMADEFNDFFGNGNIEFISLLGTLWDYVGVYRNRIKSGKSVAINNPTVSILGGNTPTSLALAFPPEVIGQGFFSRILLIYGEPNGKRIPFPKPPSADETRLIEEWFRSIKNQVHGIARLSEESEKLLSNIYQSSIRVDDVRFDPYSNRRFNHLLKLCLIVSASRMSVSISERDVICANTILSHAEFFMPKALGQFGKAKNSDVTHKVLEVIRSANGVMELMDIWQHVSSDLEKISQLVEILVNLTEAKKIQKVKGGKGFLPIRKIIDDGKNKFVDWSLLTEEERNMSI